MARNKVVNKPVVALLVALPEEMDALLRYPVKWETTRHQSNPTRTYHSTKLRNGIVIVAGMAMGMGQLNAALLARDMWEGWAPAAFILVGIAAGIGPAIALGDVAICDQVVDYELGKMTPSGLTHRWSVYRADPFLLQHAREFRDKSWCGGIKEPRPDVKEGLRLPTAHVGIFLSGNKVIASASEAGALQAVWVKAIALEMEAAGIAAAVEQLGRYRGFIAVKGVSDKADEAKNDQWHTYAAEAAVACAFNLATKLPRNFFENQMWAEGSEQILGGVSKTALTFALTTMYSRDEICRLGETLGADVRRGAQSPHGTAKNLISELNASGRLQDLINRVESDAPGLLASYLPRQELPGQSSS
jgi:nucleoside phosphorylase